MKNIKLTINPNEIKTRTFQTSEIGRGIGVYDSKKGKGSYNRKEKHKKQYTNLDSGSTAFLLLRIN